MATSLSVSGLAPGTCRNSPTPPSGVSEVTDPAILAELAAMESETAAPAPASKMSAPSREATVQIPSPTPRMQGEVSEVTDPSILRMLNGEDTTVATPDNEAVSNQLRKNLSNNVKSRDYSYDKFKGGVADTLALVGLPASAIGSALETVGVLPKGETFGGYAMIRRGYRNLFDVKGVAQPTDRFGNKQKSDEFLGTVSEFLGGAIIPGAGAVATAERKLVTALAQTGAAISGGTLAVEGKQLGETYGPMMGISKERGGELGFMLFSFGGSTIPFMAGQAVVKSMGGASKVAGEADVRSLKDLRRKLSSEEMDLMNQAAVKKEIVTAIESYPNSIENAARAIELKKKIDNFTPLPAQMTDAPAMVGMYNQVAKTNPEALGRAQMVQSQNIAALEAFKAKTFPAVQNGVGVTTGAKATLQAKSYVNGTALQELKTQLDTLSDKFVRTVDNTQLGTELREIYWSQRGAAKLNTDTELGAVYRQAKEIGLREDMGITRGVVQAIVNRDRLTFQDTPTVLNKILTQYEPGAPATVKMVPTGLLDAAGKPGMRAVQVPAAGNTTASFEELHSLYKELNKEITAARLAGQGMKVNQMDEVKKLLQTQLSKYSGEAYGDFAQNFSNYNLNYGTYARTFKEGLGGQIAKRTRSGISTDAEDIVRRLIVTSKDKRQGMLDFTNVYGGDVRASELLHDGVLDMFSKTAVVDGTLNPAAAQRWMNTHKEMLQEMPELKVALENTTKSGFGLVNRQLELRTEAKLYQKTIIAKIAQHNNSEEVINLAMRDDRYMKGLLYTAQTPENKQAVARGLLDHAWSQKDPLKFVQENALKLKPALDALGPGHWDNLKLLGLGKTINDRVKAPTSVPVGKLLDIGEEKLGVPVKGLFSRLFNTIQSREHVIMDLTGRFYYKTKMEGMAKIREAAMLDPAMAEAVVAIAKQEAKGLQPTKAQLLNLQKMSFAHGIVSFSAAVSMQNARENDLTDDQR